jgi:hypothetical protein
MIERVKWPAVLAAAVMVLLGLLLTVYVIVGFLTGSPNGSHGRGSGAEFRTPAVVAKVPHT